MVASRHPAGTTRRRLKTAVFSAITTLLVLAILEGGSRLVGHVEYPPDPLFEGQQTPRERNRQYDPLLFWRLKPNRHNADVGQVTNSLGLRGPEVPAEKGNEFRILSLGESTTYGWKVAYEDCYSALLEKYLDSVDGKRVRVINGGVPGYTIVQGYAYLRYRGVRLEPDAVLLYFGYNDFRDVAFREKRVGLGRGDVGGLTDLELLDRRRRFTSRLRDWIYRNSNLARLAGSLAHGADEPRLASSEGQPTESASGEAAAAGDHDVRVHRNVPRVPEDDRWTALEEILGLCETRGIDLVVIVPWYLGFDDHVPLLRRFAAEHGVTIVDLPSMLETAPDRPHQYFRDLSHPNEAGHELIASAIAEVVSGS